MIIKYNGRPVTQGAVITSIVETDQWSVTVNVTGPAPNPGVKAPSFELVFSRQEYDRLHARDEETPDCLLTVATSAADPTFFAYNIDPRGMAGWRAWVEHKLNDHLYQPVATNDVVLTARRYGIDSVRFEQRPGCFTRDTARYEGEHLRRQFRAKLD